MFLRSTEAMKLGEGTEGGSGGDFQNRSQAEPLRGGDIRAEGLGMDRSQPCAELGQMV